MEFQRRGNIGTREMMFIAFALLASAALIYAWTKGLPMETQKLATGID